MSNAALTHVWKHSKQASTHLLVMIALADAANNDGVCWWGKTKLSERCRLTEARLKTVIRDLERAGELQVIEGGYDKEAKKNVSNHYLIMGLAEPSSEARPIEPAKPKKRNFEKAGGGNTVDPHTGVTRLTPRGIDGLPPVGNTVDPQGGYTVDPKPSLEPSSNPPTNPLPRTSRGEFSNSKFYLVSNDRKVVYVKGYAKVDALAECERLHDYGVIAVKGSDLNAAADDYTAYERRKPQTPRNATFDAFGEGAFNLPVNFDTSNIGKDGGRIGKLVSQLASHLDRTFNDIVNDPTVAARVQAYYKWRKTDDRYKNLSARDPLVFLGEWRDFEEWERSRQNIRVIPSPQPTTPPLTAAERAASLQASREARAKMEAGETA